MSTIMSSKSIKKTKLRNLKLCDSQCLLVQFRNERKKPIQVGFQAWLKDNIDMTKEDMLNKEVIIHWPLDMDIMCAKSMEKKLKNRLQDQDKWTDLLVKVISTGEWTEMCQQAKNIEKFGVPNPDRKQRHALCKKQTSEESDNNSSHENSSDEEKQKMRDSDNKKKTSIETNYNKINHLTSEVTSKRRMKQSSNKSTQRDYNSNINATILSQITNAIEETQNIIISDEESDTSYQLHKQSKDRLITKIQILEEENKRLRLDNSRLRVLRCVNEDLKQMKELSSYVLRDLKYLKKSISKEYNENSHDISNNKNSEESKETVPSIINDISNNKNSEKSTQKETAPLTTNIVDIINTAV